MKHIGNIETVIEPIIGAPHTDYYRNKVQFPISSSEDRLFPAFYQPRSHRAIDISDYCKLQPEVMNQIAVDACDVLSELGETAYNEVLREGNIRHLLIRKSSIDGSVLLCVICRLGYLCDENRFIKKMCDLHPEISTIVTNKNETEGNEILSETHRVIYGSGYIEDVIADVPVNIAYDSFYQINQESTENLYRCVKDFASVKENDVVVDLYCGAGTIGLSCSGNDCVLIGVDVIGRSIESARNAASQLGRKNAEFVIGDSSYLQTIIENGIRPSLIITDPPRKGCSSSVIQSIISSKTEKIVMVSCNPSTLARDLKLLMDGGYNLDKIQPVDMFPRTKHVETVCCLYHQKKDFFFVPYEPKDAEYLKKTK